MSDVKKLCVLKKDYIVNRLSSYLDCLSCIADASRTVPLIGLFCAESSTQKREANIIDIATALANKFPSIEKLVC